MAAQKGRAAGIPGEHTSQGSGHPRGAGNNQLNLAIMAMQAGTSVQAENKGRLADPAPLTSVITVKKGGDVMMVGCLFDGGSESSYFHPDNERMATSRRRKVFQLETLSMQGQVEEDDGLLLSFEAVMVDGQVKKIKALKHHGLGESGKMLLAKVLSVPVGFANHWNLEEQSMTRLDPSNPGNALYTRQSQRMMLVVGMDLCHHFPQLLDSYRDDHGVVQLHSCPFSGRIIACGNRTFPLSTQNVKNILKRLDSTTGFIGTIY